MPLPGRPPSESPRNRNAKTHDWSPIENTPYVGLSPGLPPKGGRLRWHRETQA